jgi:hypothetical protein
MSAGSQPQLDLLPVTQAGDSRKLYPNLYLLACHAVLCVIGGFRLALVGMTSHLFRRTADASTQDMRLNH